MAWKELGAYSFADAFIPSHELLEEFDTVSELIDWQTIESLLSPICNSKVGKKAYPPLVLFKAVLLQKWHNLSDVQLEKQLVRDLLFKRFTGLSLNDPTPDHSTISRFRKRILEHNLEDKLMIEINVQLQASGAMIKTGAISIIDASVVEAKNARPKTNPKGEKTQDKEARYTSKVGADGQFKTTYGFKNHMNVDEDGLIQKTLCTAANLHDSKPFEQLLTGKESAATADKAYFSKRHLALLKAKEVKNMLLYKAARNRPLTEEQQLHNLYASQVRNVVERVFGTLKTVYGMGKARYLGIRMNQLDFIFMAIAYNLKRGNTLLKIA